MCHHSETTWAFLRMYDATYTSLMRLIGPLFTTFGIITTKVGQIDSLRAAATAAARQGHRMHLETRLSCCGDARVTPRPHCARGSTAEASHVRSAEYSPDVLPNAVHFRHPPWNARLPGRHVA